MERSPALADGVSLPMAAALPVLGDAHPLRLRYRRFLFWAVSIAASIHLTAVASWMLLRVTRTEISLPVETIVIEMLPPPMPIDHLIRKKPVSNALSIIRPAIGEPFLVPDYEALHSTTATQSEISEVLSEVDLPAFESGNVEFEILKVPEARGKELQSPDDFVPVEKLPILVTLPAPVYPELARMAGVEGTVMVRVLVGVDGKIVDAFATEGVPMLDEAALVAARQAVFRPALQQNRPVAVWVQIPMRFVLN